MSCGKMQVRRGESNEECRLRWVAYLPPETMVLFRPEVGSRVMSAPVAFLQTWSVLMLAPVTTEGLTAKRRGLHRVGSSPHWHNTRKNWSYPSLTAAMERASRS